MQHLLVYKKNFVDIKDNENLLSWNPTKYFAYLSLEKKKDCIIIY